MKRLIIAAVAVMGLGFGLANAVEMDFDGKGTGSMYLMKEIKATRGEYQVACAYPMKCSYICTSTKNVNGDIAAVPAPTPVKVDIHDTKSEECKINRSIKTAIAYTEKKGLSDLKVNFEKLLTKGTLQEKLGFVNNNNKSYDFPRRLFIAEEAVGSTNSEKATNACHTSHMTSATQMKGGTPYCVAWGTQHVCVDKLVCKYTCVIVGATVATWGSVNGVWQIIIPAALGTEVCKDVCANVPICTDVPYCTQWETEII